KKQLIWLGWLFQLPMSSEQEAMLLSLSGDANYQSAVTTLYRDSQNGQGATAPLASLPTIALQSRISYESAAKQLQFSGGPMTSDQRALLLSLAPDPSYQATIGSLFRAQAPYATAPLAALPNITFPDLSRPISYDASAKRLRFTGAMTEADRKLFLSLS